MWYDQDADTLYNWATEGGFSDGVDVVELWKDNDNSGTVTAGDLLIQTATSSTSDGSYTFVVAATGNFVLQVDTSTLPGGTSLTTNNVEAASFSTLGNTESNNDFGVRHHAHHCGGGRL